MEDARYLRAQALLLLEIARQMSDPKAAKRIRSEAAAYEARAAEIEEPQESS